MRSTRRAVISAFTLTTLSVLTACSSSTTSSSPPPATTGAGNQQPSPGSTMAAATTSASTPVSGEIVVLAAASLRESLIALAEQFQAANPEVSVSLDFQGSQDLVTALSEGAEADVLVTASTTTMDAALEEGLVEEPAELATNVLTLIVPSGNPAAVTGLTDGSLEDTTLVVCAPEVPCGEATTELASELGITLSPVSEEQKVTDVRGKVESGEADAGIVYATDALNAGDKVEQINLPANSVVNHYLIAVTTRPVNAEAAQALVSFLLSEDAQTVLQETFGFGAPGDR